MTQPERAIVVVNYRSSELLAVNLVAISESDTEMTVVVVDNFSDALERERVAALCNTHDWTPVLLDDNRGFGGGMNAGVGRALELGCTVLLLVNPDAVIDRVSIDALADRVRDHELTLVSPVVERPDGSLWFAGSDLYLDDGRVRSARRRSEAPEARIMPWLSGACLLLSARLWTMVGGFDDRYFLYWEDIDLSRRVIDAGGEVEVVASAKAIHAEGGTQGGAGHDRSGQPKSDLYYYYNVRNRLLFAALHLSRDEQRAWTRHAARVGWEIVLQGGRRQLLRSTSPIRAAIRGTRDGLALARGLTHG